MSWIDLLTIARAAPATIASISISAPIAALAPIWRAQGLARVEEFECVTRGILQYGLGEGCRD